MTNNIFDFLKSVQWLETNDRIDQAEWKHIEHGFCGRQPPTTTSPPANFKRAKQVHGTKIVSYREISVAPATEADGVYTLERNSPCAIQTADCLPILLYSKVNDFRAAIHAGWKGITSGIMIEAIALYRRIGVPEDLLIGIGPAISQSRFEVGPEVLDAVSRPGMGLTLDQIAMVTAKGIRDRWHIDLQTTAALQLANLNLPARNISIMRSCTWNEKDTWYSYRREGKGCGMNVSWIM